MARLFFGLSPDEATRAALARWAGAAHAAAGGRRTQPRNLHMTLAFLGETGARQMPALQAAAAPVRMAPCVMRLGQCRYWKHNRIVWAGGEAPQALLDAVHDLQASLGAAGIGFDARPFAPHVTLLRNARAVPQLPQPSPVDWPIRDFVLFASERDEAGLAYRIVAGPFGGV